MKYAFSTLACPDWSWSEILATAKDFGFDGIEVRGIGSDLYAPDAKPFRRENAAKTAMKLQHLQLDLCCLSSDCMLNDRANIDSHRRNAKAYIDTAAMMASASENMASPYVRILADTAPECRDAVNVSEVAQDLRALAAYAAEQNVTILTETNGVFANTDTMMELLTRVDHPNVAVIWDIHHTCRFFGEPPAQTYARLKKYIRHVHVKDSVMNHEKVIYQMLGAGDIPVLEALEALRTGGFNGFISLEWVKRWCPELAEPGIVFPLFISYVKQGEA